MSQKRACGERYKGTKQNALGKCKDTGRARQRRWYKANPKRYAERQRIAQLKRLYGLTLQEYDIMLSKQKGLCAICNTILVPGRETIIDHNHETGKNRDLLCGSCNKVLGFAKDRPETLRLAAEYLEFHNKEN